jgi:hypothetical protein
MTPPRNWRKHWRMEAEGYIAGHRAGHFYCLCAWAERILFLLDALDGEEP